MEMVSSFLTVPMYKISPFNICWFEIKFNQKYLAIPSFTINKKNPF
ncbi:hypothetical protein JFU03_22200 [Bacillus sp. TH44]|nr:MULTISPECIES: hypothetical protein [unclassified Bacillus (in: firmicutes)]MBK5345827.1 hypothetical protein [Bacillus sp. TH45]MBK5360558.1 hypothetical protein [Bacillus sp. TH44]MBK5367455.1 hypothetical protein [Bacillus sp. TH50]